jgi:cobaltochelatase CobT
MSASNPVFKNILFEVVNNFQNCDQIKRINQELRIELSQNLANNFFNWNQDLADNNKIILPEFEENENLSIIEIIKKYRPSSDMALLYLLFHNQEIHQQNSYLDEPALSSFQALLDAFEKGRVILKVSKLYLGIAKNIIVKINQDIEILENENELLPLLILSELFDKKNNQKTFKLLTEFKQRLDKQIVKKLEELKDKIDDQKNFLKLSKEIINLFYSPFKNNAIESSPQNQGLKLENESFNLEKQDNDSNNFGLKEELEEERKKSISFEVEIKKIKELEGPKKIIVKVEEGGSEEKIEFRSAYKIYTNKFDEVCLPQKLLSKIELESLRLQLDLKLSKLNNISQRLVLKLKKKLLAKKYSPIQYNKNEGLLNRKKLTQIILNSKKEDIWINMQEHNYQDTIITILIDNSGSMRGLPIVMSALASEIIAGTLEKFLIRTEILGFTTADWKGGRSRKLWEISGKEKNPGRLNDLRHIIYKEAHKNLKQAKINLGLMLKEGVLKENIDSEALLWAKSRLMQYKETRKILMVISDGAPIDDSTTNMNDNKNLLEDHLHAVISRIEKQSKIELVGVGIGHDVNQFYRNSIVIKNPDELGDVMIEKIIELL